LGAAEDADDDQFVAVIFDYVYDDVGQIYLPPIQRCSGSAVMTEARKATKPSDVVIDAIYR